MALRVEELLTSLIPRLAEERRSEEGLADWYTPIAGCHQTGCPATQCPSTDCGTTGCTSTGCGATQCGSTGCGTTACGSTSCGGTSCGTTGCGTTGCGDTDCGTTGCGSTETSKAPGCGDRGTNYDDVVNPAPELAELRAQLAGIANLMRVSRIYKTSKAAEEEGGLALEDVVALENKLAKAITEFYAG
jgi:hypothetical protein